MSRITPITKPSNISRYLGNHLSRESADCIYKIS